VAKFTTQLRTIIESNYPIFDFDYPIFDENYRPVLESKIINHFYFREIGLETVGQWKWFLKEKLNLIMPYYNKFYNEFKRFESDFDPYKNKNVYVEETRTTEGESSSKSDGESVQTSEGNSREVFQDTPTNKLMSTKDYATNLTDNTSTGEGKNVSTGETTGTAKTTDTFLSHTYGHDGMRYPSDILSDLLKIYLNIDQMILDELDELFMGVY
jgi:hypothetical protein